MIVWGREEANVKKERGVKEGEHSEQSADDLYHSQVAEYHHGLSELKGNRDGLKVHEQKDGRDAARVSNGRNVASVTMEQRERLLAVSEGRRTS